ncbi:aminotransferase class I/II-fold pyridoxal phosphate-dependent enzyme [Belliella kenyensis]|uniref:Aminotransferase class I/II-fold pyridoxal phosphate-dependent enzyme n=1 Tax=Belliella kenyensis TaxID=1472724 RepID=A0ABV8EK47_9BACT|nr:aminotransferase class I/II-fold pyridoxal phosphate-dependent enzyme [Belliella kenyensis]MCH7403681.1 aminotransferase class I/II-fold pyridoxal phosphate-dependent enzyme [Belliella kenyensis]MDN3603448.1 aminotransferase class I/II-fold pyridoxal phosphate-dependent enzyme [Belliella kenyensis]
MNPIFHHHKIDRTVWADGQECLFFSGTSYLGMSASEDFAALVSMGLKQYGVNHGLSRSNNLRLSIYEEFETFVAKQAGAEKALVYSSGYLAGQAASSLIAKDMDAIFVAPATHPAIFPYGNAYHVYDSLAEWRQCCLDYASNHSGQKIAIFTNALDALKPEVYDLSWIASLPDTNSYTLLIDDSHAFGVIGGDIYGSYSTWKHLPVELIVSGSMGKGLSIPAGIVLGSASFIDRMEMNAMYRGASPPPPAFLWAFLNAQSLYKVQFRKLQHNIKFFKSLIHDINVHSGDWNLPVFRLLDEAHVKSLQQHKIVFSSFAYPTDDDPVVSRIIISAWHEEGDLMDLKDALMN